MTSGAKTTSCIKHLILKLQELEPNRSPRSSPESSSKKQKTSSSSSSVAVESAVESYKAAPSTPSKDIKLRRAPSLDDIRAYLGAQDSPGKASSAAETIASSPGSIANSPKKKYVEQYLWSEACMVRYAEGKLLARATMRDGLKGFKVAIWPNGEETETEIPNITVGRKPAAADKAIRKPATKGRGAAKRPAIRSEEEEENGDAEEEEEGEDGEEEEEEEEENEDDEEEEGDKAEAPMPTMCNYEFESKTWNRCKAEFYSKKAYIRYWDDADRKWRLVIGSVS